MTVRLHRKEFTLLAPMSEPFRHGPPLATLGPRTLVVKSPPADNISPLKPPPPLFSRACVAAADKRTPDKRKHKLWWGTHCEPGVQKRTSARWNGKTRREIGGGGGGKKKEENKPWRSKRREWQGGKVRIWDWLEENTGWKRRKRKLLCILRLKAEIRLRSVTQNWKILNMNSCTT